MGKAKMFKIESIDTFPNVFQNEHFTKPLLKNSGGNELDLKGKWRSEVFKNQNPIVLELACGKGDYAVALAEKYRDKNFIGIDSKGARIYTGAKNAREKRLDNLVFVRMKIENITHFFSTGEVDEIWITFPDPFPRKRDAKRRLSQRAFLERYQGICKPGSIIHFKTDDLPLFDFTEAEVIEKALALTYCKRDIYSAPLAFDERMHLSEGRKINYLRFTT